jgi:excisionase family DNA binding protein
MNYLTIDEFAEKMKMHSSTIRRAINQGKIFALRLDLGLGKRSHYRIPESELERLHLQSICEGKSK